MMVETVRQVKRAGIPGNREGAHLDSHRSAALRAAALGTTAHARCRVEREEILNAAAAQRAALRWQCAHREDPQQESHLQALNSKRAGGSAPRNLAGSYYGEARSRL